MRFLITGGAGFIGCNLACRLMDSGHQVIIIDNLSRPGSVENLQWLKTRGEMNFEKIDIQDYEKLSNVVKQYVPDVIIHEAAQVAVTTSITNPREDFEINVLGTLNVLESIRNFAPEAILLFASTNKVYGALEGVQVEELDKQYRLKDFPYGISEDFPLDFHSPYGCSKGAADQYVRDYSRIYGLRTVVFRQSCIYGPHQFGMEDQGWVAWFTIASVLGVPITIYGNGKQVRDILYVDDLIDAYLLSIEKIEIASGKIYNIGGGRENSLSLINLIDILRDITGREIEISFSDWRPGDQKVFICDIIKISEDLGWKPKIDVKKGIELLFDWVVKNKDIIKKVRGL